MKNYNFMKKVITLFAATALTVAVSVTSYAGSGSTTKTTSGGSSGKIGVKFTSTLYTTSYDFASAEQKVTNGSSIYINMSWTQLIAIDNNANKKTYTNLGNASRKNSYTFYKQLGSAGTYASIVSTQKAQSSAFGSVSATLNVKR